MRIDVGCRFEVRAAQPTHAVVLVEPHLSELGRIAASSFELDPASRCTLFFDQYGNACRRLDLEAGTTTLSFDAEVLTFDAADATDPSATEAPVPELPHDTLAFLLPSRFCESDVLSDTAIARFGSVAPGWSRVQAVNDWVHSELRFQYGMSSPSLSAVDVLESGGGVCRDFSHLAIATCRALSIPARYVFGYLPDIDVPDPGTPMDFCAWMEVFLGGRWYTFDPRNNERRVGRTVIGRGRDAADVAMVTSFGRLDLLSMTVRAELHPTEPAPA